VRLIAPVAIALTIAASSFLLAPAARASSLPTCDNEGQFLDHNIALAWMPVAGGFQSTDDDCLLSIGDSSDAVDILQNDLDACYKTHLMPDGIFGPLTMAALESVQRSVGITPDGIYGPVTRDHIRWLDANSQCFIDA
jgi:peptidoglycan hydrolase-like protein with peptidoglycan-binding domain